MTKCLKILSISIALITLATLNVASGLSLPASLLETTEKISREYPDIESIDVDSFLESFNKHPWLVVDVRDRDKRNISTIPYAVDIKTLEDTVNLKKNPKRILIFDTVGREGAEITRELNRNGIAAFNLKGGIIAWALHSMPLHDPDGNKTHKIHVGKKIWDILPDSYNTVWDLSIFDFIH